MNRKIKNRKLTAAVLTAVMAVTVSLSGCGEKTEETLIVREDEIPLAVSGCLSGCTCTGCICCGTAGTQDIMASVSQPETESASVTESASGTEEDTETETGQEESDAAETSEMSETPETGNAGENAPELSEIEKLSAGEIEARM